MLNVASDALVRRDEVLDMTEALHVDRQVHDPADVQFPLQTFTE